MFFRVGFQIVDIECKIKDLKASWVPRLTRNKGVLFNIFESYCNRLNMEVNYVLHFSDKKEQNMQKIRNLPIFYQQMLCSFNECKLSNIENKSSCSILQQLIWNNRNFMYKGNTLVFF